KPIQKTPLKLFSRERREIRCEARQQNFPRGFSIPLDFDCRKSYRNTMRLDLSFQIPDRRQGFLKHVGSKILLKPWCAGTDLKRQRILPETARAVHRLMPPPVTPILFSLDFAPVLYAAWCPISP